MWQGWLYTVFPMEKAIYHWTATKEDIFVLQLIIRSTDKHPKDQLMFAFFRVTNGANLFLLLSLSLEAPLLLLLMFLSLGEEELQSAALPSSYFLNRCLTKLSYTKAAPLNCGSTNQATNTNLIWYQTGTLIQTRNTSNGSLVRILREESVRL